MLEKPYGYIDLPITPETGGSDELNIEAYYEGLAAFVSNCQTPMTIAVQGDWGSGKSTALNFVKSKLEDSVYVIEFNTWLYSQFELGDSLVFSMAHEILQPIAKGSPAGKKMMGALAAMSLGAVRGGAEILGVATGTSAIVTAISEALRNATYSDDAPNIIAQLKELRELFATAVEEHCKKNNKSRVAVIIDDLDRVEPERAIEILEGLKLFFEVPNCVFVLALDFDVVVRGVRKRYGTGFDDKKARQYFDKIIQVPFAMPIGSFNVDSIIESALHRSGILQGSRSADAAKYVRVARWSVGTNPRSLKRLLNSFELLQLILASQDMPLLKAEDKLPLIVFALLCAQAAYPTLHAMLTLEITDDDDIEKVMSAESLEDVELERIYKIEKSEIRKFRNFLDYFATLSGSAEDDTELDIEILKKGIKLSQVTSVGFSRAVESDLESKAVGTTGIFSAVRDKSSERSASLFEKLAMELGRKLGSRSFTMIEQSGSNQITLYAMDDADEIMKLAPRLRPRFAAIGYNRKGLHVIFGKANATFDTNSNEASYGDEWDRMIPDLLKRFPNEGGPAGAKFRFRPTGYPFILDGISNEEGLDDVCDYLVQIYDVIAGQRVR